MPKFNDHSLSRFLSKPRFLYDVAKHFGISKELAEFHLREAVRSGQVLVSERPVFHTLRLSNGRTKRLGGFVYVLGKSPVLMNHRTRFSVRKLGGSTESKSEVPSFRFLSSTDALKTKETVDHKLPCSGSERTMDSRVNVHRLKTSGPLASQFDTSRSKVKLARPRTIEVLLRHRTGSVDDETKSLSHVERIRLFRALLKEPLPFLDLHSCFGVSKQVVGRLAKNGFIKEVWGPKAIGVRFGLTSKGRIYLRELEAAAKYKPMMRETGFIRLKQRAPV